MSKIDYVVIWIMAIAVVVLTGSTLYLNNKCMDLEKAYSESVELTESYVETINSKTETIDKENVKYNKLNDEYKEFQKQVFNMINGEAYEFSIYNSEDNTTYIYHGNGSLFSRTVSKIR